MDNFQDFLTLAATVMEYFFFGYLAVAFMIYSLKLPRPAQQVRSTSMPYKTWERSVKPGVPLAGMAG